MRKLLALAIILLIAIGLASVRITFATHTATVAWVKESPLDPTYPPHPGAPNEYHWNGYTPKWINFTVANNANSDPIREIKAVFMKDAEGNSYFNFSQTRQNVTGWYATPDEFGPNKRPTVIYFRTDSSQNYIQAGQTGRFDFFMTEGPKEECSHNVDVWTVDAGSATVINPATNYYELFIMVDNHLPAIEITYPANGTIFKDGETVWVNATATDTEGLHPSAIKKVELWFNYIEKNGTSTRIFIDLMKYDAVRKVYWWKTTSGKLRNEAWHKATAIAYDYAENTKESVPVSFFWFIPRPIISIKNLDPCFLQNTSVGHVGSNVRLDVWTGFKPSSTVTVYFGTINVGGNTTNTFGNFTLTFQVPETPRNVSLLDSTKTLPYTIRVTDGTITNVTSFTVVPWMWIDTKEAFVGDQVTVTGKGFAASADVNILYRDVDLGTVYWDWGLEWSQDATKFEWKPYLGNLTMGKVRTNTDGTLTLTFNVPESYGGFHPIYGKEATSGVRSGWLAGVTPTPSPDNSYPQAAFLKVKTRVWITEMAGLGGQYITIEASGLPLAEYSNKTYNCLTRTTTVDNHNWTLAIDFGPSNRWVFEKGFILNNEFDYAWSSKLYLPFAYYYNHADPASLSWNGTLCWRDAQGQYYKGSQFLKVPSFMPDNYEVYIYQFNIQTLQDDVQYKAATTFLALKDPLYVRVSTGTLYFAGENVTAYAETDLDGIITDPTAISFYLYREDTFITSLTPKRLDTGIYAAMFTCPSTKGNYFIKVNATKTFGDFEQSGFGISSFAVSPTLDGFNATLTALSGGLATIQTTIGQISANISQINGQIANVEGRIATINTDIGQIKTDISTINGKLAQIDTVITTLSDLNGKIVTMGTNIATIQTDVGTIKITLDSINTQIVAVGTNTVEIKTALGDIQGTITSIQGKTVDIQTSIGKVTTTADSIKTDTGLQTTSLALSLIAALAAIIAAVLIFRKLYT